MKEEEEEEFIDAAEALEEDDEDADDKNWETDDAKNIKRRIEKSVRTFYIPLALNLFRCYEAPL